ncbi:MAG: Isoquinoline 1-oxidoreductase subunit [Polyangiales bacterium]
MRSKTWTLGKIRILGACLLAVGVVLVSRLHVSATPRAATTATELRTAASFDSIRDQGERSRALFTEAGKVITHARCLNCHPAGDQPSQGEGLAPHLPAVVRGSDGHGAVGLRCNTCHQIENYAPSGVPGHPLWGLAPLEMAWQGRTLAEICAQIKDPKRNGGKTLAQIHEHMAHDTLVGWGWSPGSTRKPAPGSQATFGALIGAWIATGAECPR